MAGERLALSLYLLRRDATPFSAVPSLQSLHVAGTTAVAPTATDGSADEAFTLTGVLAQDTTEPNASPGLTVGPLPDERRTSAMVLRSVPSQPAWLGVATARVPGLPATDSGVNVGLLFFHPVGREVVVWSFGSAWGLLDPEKTEPRFGLRVGLNALLSVAAPPASSTRVGVRGLQSAVRADVVRQSTLLTGRPASPSSIERLDQTSDGAKLAELTTHHPTFRRVAAGRALRFEAPVTDERDLFRFARQAVRLHRRDDYQKSAEYQWIDNTVPVADRTTIDRVLDAVWAASSTGSDDVDVIWAPPDPDTGLHPETVRFPLERDVGRTTLTWERVKQRLAKTAGTAGRDLLRLNLRWFVGTEPTQSSELWEHLVTQIEVDGTTYVVSDGTVWQASPEYLEKMNDDLTARVKVNPANLPRWQMGDDEDTYNKRAAAKGHVLLDKTFLQKKGETKLELGDLLSADGRLMHVKRKTRASVMSHVTTQATAAVQLVRNDADARKLAVDLVKASTPGHPNQQQLLRHIRSMGGRPTVAVDVVIVGTWRGSPNVGQLPLLTRLSLSGWIRNMPVDTKIVLVGT